MLKMLRPPTLNIADARDSREDWASSVSYLPLKAFVIIFYVMFWPLSTKEHLVLGLNIQFKVLSD